MYLAMDDTCLPCPANSNSTQSGLSVCPCFEGYYRADGEPPEMECTRKSCTGVCLLAASNLWDVHHQLPYLHQPSIFTDHICILDKELGEIWWGRVGGIRSWCYGDAVFVLKEDREDTECSIACSNSNK